MRTLLRKLTLVVVPDSDDERAAVDALPQAPDGYVFKSFRSAGAMLFEPLGAYEVLYRVPINVTSRHPDPSVRLIGNFAATPFEIDGARYASVEGFWQCLRVPEGEDRRRIAAMRGSDAKREGTAFGAPDTVIYLGQSIAWGSPDHWDLMRKACRAKFEQSDEARAALLATAPRPLQHTMRRDSASIPGVVMAGIWMHLRDEFAFRAARAARAAR